MTKSLGRSILQVNKDQLIYFEPKFQPSLRINPKIIPFDLLDAKFIKDNITNPKVVGIGEIGLDYHYDDTDKELQKKYFIEQIKIAKEYNKTVGKI